MRVQTSIFKYSWRLTGVFLLLCFVAPAAHSITGLAPASATIVYPIAVSTLSGLAFGEITRSNTGGTVTITADGQRLPGAGVDVIADSAFTAAGFAIMGEPGANYVVSLPASATISNGTDSMMVDNFTATALSGILAGGEQKIAVGATLHISAEQTVGKYIGTFDVTVSYN